MAQPRRSAPRRTADAIAEDLRLARKSGGLWRATEADLAATLDFLALAAPVIDEEPVARARDLLITFVRRGIEQHRLKRELDKASQAAATSLETLLLRPPTNRRKVQSIRQEAAREAGHLVTADAMRHREDNLIDQIAQAACADLQARRGDEPHSVEEAIHRLMPIAADLRDHMHIGLCLTYLHVPPADPYEARVINGYYRRGIVKMGELLSASQTLAVLGRHHPDLTEDETYFVYEAREINHFILGANEERQFLLRFTRSNLDAQDWEARIDLLLSTEKGRSLYERWRGWADSCYPTCAFERSPDPSRMCSPHHLVTLLYALEIRYRDLGLSKLDLPENWALLRHHGAQL